MPFDFSPLFHESSKDHGGHGRVYIPVDAKEWPKEWKTTYYKSYPRFEKISLPAAKPTGEFSQLLEKRMSRKNFDKTPVSLEQLSALLRYSCGITRSYEKLEWHLRAQASGGALYPIEVYPLVLAGSDELPAGIYHYAVRDHALDVLWQRPFSQKDIGELFSYEWVREASCVLLMTAIFRRNQQKYGERGYRYILIETGHIGQNLYLTSGGLGLKCCALGGTRDAALEKLIDIDGVTESVIYSVAVG